MKNIIRKGLTLLLFNLAVLTPVSSQITLDSIEAKETALIFAEHEKLSIENPLLKQQISSLESLNELYLKKDSLRNQEINLYVEKIVSDDKIIKNLKSTQKKIIIGSSIGGILLLILGILI